MGAKGLRASSAWPGGRRDRAERQSAETLCRRGGAKVVGSSDRVVGVEKHRKGGFKGKAIGNQNRAAKIL